MEYTQEYELSEPDELKDILVWDSYREEDWQDHCEVEAELVGGRVIPNVG